MNRHYYYDPIAVYLYKDNAAILKKTPGKEKVSGPFSS
jgi:hypothetical protein